MREETARLVRFIVGPLDPRVAAHMLGRHGRCRSGAEARDIAEYLPPPPPTSEDETLREPAQVHDRRRTARSIYRTPNP